MSKDLLNDVGQATIFKPTRTKCCRTCKEEKHASNFNKDKGGKGGLHPHCIQCQRKKHKKWCEDNDDKIRASRRNRRLKARYGISNADYKKMEDGQNGVCAICGQEAKWEYGLCVDHCHETDIVRGLLCNSCNSGLGCFYDNTAWLKKAIEYLQNSNSNKTNKPIR